MFKTRSLHINRLLFSNGGFTLLELLTVTAVIAVLASMLLPVLAKAKVRARDITCISNLNQWGRATHLYASENNDRLPKDGSPNGLSTESGWYIDLARTAGAPAYHGETWRTNAEVSIKPSIWICPSNRRRSNGNNLFHYCLNQHVNGRGSGKQADLSDILRPAATVWMFDNGKEAAVAQQNNVHTNLHRGGAHFLFLDGHAAHFKAGEYWDPGRGKGITNNPALRWVP